MRSKTIKAQGKKYTKKLNNNLIWIYGRHACEAALENNTRIVQKIYLLKNKKNSDNFIKSFSTRKSIIEKVSYVDNKFFHTKVGKDVKHQGVLISAKRINIFDYSQLFNNKMKDEKLKLGIILDNITDPNNVGAIYRSARAFNVSFIINAETKSISESSSLLNVACGAFETINSYSCKNINDCIKKFKENGWWVVGMDTDAKEEFNSFLNDINKNEKFIFILGSEGKGIRRLVKKNCDYLYKISTENNQYSLNVSNAAAIVFYGFFNALN